ncbi:MAG: hypothetical protein JW795_09315 [Chitinivibrionales bacterium]|nr:hypothetical protein [Chitinivibrionales bacterium]
MKLKYLIGNSSGSAILFVLLIGLVVLLGSMTTLISSKHTNKVTEERKSNVTAFNIAEAGSQNALAMLRSFRAFPKKNATIPLLNQQPFSGGSYSVECQANAKADTVWLTSVGDFNGQSKQLKLMCEVGDTTTLAQFPPYTMWCIRSDSRTLYYYVYDASKPITTSITMYTEGTINLVNPPAVANCDNKQDIVVGDDGVIYFVNIPPSSATTTGAQIFTTTADKIDHDPATGVDFTYRGFLAERLGNGMVYLYRDVTNIEVIKDTLWCVAFEPNDTLSKRKNRLLAFKLDMVSNDTLFPVNPERNRFFGSTSDTFAISALSKGNGLHLETDRVMYFMRKRSSGSELWKITNFPNTLPSSRSKVCTIEGGTDIENLAAHPDGYFYIASQYTSNFEVLFYKIDPNDGSKSLIHQYVNREDYLYIKGLSFYYKGERDKLLGNNRPYNVLSWQELR